MCFRFEIYQRKGRAEANEMQASVPTIFHEDFLSRTCPCSYAHRKWERLNSELGPRQEEKVKIGKYIYCNKIQWIRGQILLSLLACVHCYIYGSIKAILWGGCDDGNEDGIDNKYKRQLMHGAIKTYSPGLICILLLPRRFARAEKLGKFPKHSRRRRRRSRLLCARWASKWMWIYLHHKRIRNWFYWIKFHASVNLNFHPILNCIKLHLRKLSLSLKYINYSRLCETFPLIIKLGFIAAAATLELFRKKSSAKFPSLCKVERIYHCCISKLFDSIHRRFYHSIEGINSNLKEAKCLTMKNESRKCLTIDFDRALKHLMTQSSLKKKKEKLFCLQSYDCLQSVIQMNQLKFRLTFQNKLNLRFFSFFPGEETLSVCFSCLCCLVYFF